jgi:hypothetical protein
MEKRHDDHELGTGFFVMYCIVLYLFSVQNIHDKDTELVNIQHTHNIKRTEFVGDRTSYITLRGPWFHIFVLNVHALTEDKIDYVKDNFYEELERVFEKCPKYL